MLTNPRASAGDTASNPWSRTIPSAEGQLTPCTATPELCSRALAPQQEKLPQREAPETGGQPLLAATRGKTPSATETQPGQSRNKVAN